MKEKGLWESSFEIVGFTLGRRRSMNANQSQIKKNIKLMVCNMSQ